MRFSKKELGLTVAGSLFAAAGVGVSDPWIFFPFFAGSWLAFVWLCIRHEGRRISRVTIALAITGAMSLLAWRAHESAKRNDSTVQFVAKLLTAGVRLKYSARQTIHCELESSTQVINLDDIATMTMWGCSRDTVEFLVSQT